jgi:hypothetical protein
MVVIIAVKEETIIDSGTKLIITVEEDHIDIKILEKIAGEIT